MDDGKARRKAHDTWRDLEALIWGHPTHADALTRNRLHRAAEAAVEAADAAGYARGSDEGTGHHDRPEKLPDTG